MLLVLPLNLRRACGVEGTFGLAAAVADAILGRTFQVALARDLLACFAETDEFAHPLHPTAPEASWPRVGSDRASASNTPLPWQGTNLPSTQVCNSWQAPSNFSLSYNVLPPQLVEPTTARNSKVFH